MTLKAGEERRRKPVPTTSGNYVFMKAAQAERENYRGRERDRQTLGRSLSHTHTHTARDDWETVQLFPAPCLGSSLYVYFSSASCCHAVLAAPPQRHVDSKISASALSVERDGKGREGVRASLRGG